MDAILAARHEHRLGPHRLAPLVGVPRSTIGDVLNRHGLSRLRDQEGPTGIPIRYVRERPGELLHIDVKKLGRIPEGGGHRMLGRSPVPRAPRGYDYLHVAIDDMSRVAYVAPFDDERGVTCARFLLDAASFFARHGVRIERVLTDNAKNYTLSKAFAGALEEDRRSAPGDPAVPSADQWQGGALQLRRCSVSGPMSAVTTPIGRGWTRSRHSSPNTTSC